MTDGEPVPTPAECQLQMLTVLLKDVQAQLTALKIEIDMAASPAIEIAADEVRTPANGTAGTEDPASVNPLSRRGALLALGGVAAGGVGMAIGSTFLGAEQAAATQGSAVLAGETNTATGTTEVTTTAGAGIQGISSASDGVQGDTTHDGSSGVSGSDTSAAGGFGISGTSNEGTGVHGVAIAPSGIDLPAVQIGVLGETANGWGVCGTSSQGYGVVGESNAAGAGGLGGVDLSSGGNGVYGVSNAGNGVHGIVGGFSGAVPSQPIGVLGETNLSGGVGVYGSSAGGYGVGGYSTVSDGVSGGTAADGQSGVSGFDVSATGGYGLYGQSEVIGGVGVLAKNTGQGPQLLLSPSTNTALPATSSPGQFIVLSDGSLWYSYLTNEWVQLNNGIVALPAPVRVIDTTSSGGSVGGIAGPLVPGATVHTTSVLTGGASNIPVQALGLVGNFAISGVGGALLNGFGVATIFPAGSSTPATANINAGAGCFAISNSVTVRFGTGTSAGRLSIVWSGGGPVPEAQAFFDVTGYLL